MANIHLPRHWNMKPSVRTLRLTSRGRGWKGQLLPYAEKINFVPLLGSSSTT
jgi:hypothetical protein